MNKNLPFCLLIPVLILANPHKANAENSPLKLGVSGHVKIYGNYAKQDGNVRKTDILRDTDVTFSGETALENGLTIGAVINADGDAGDSFDIEDSFIFAESHWGRLSAGVEDGAVFMLQVATPSADENVDGLEPFVSPINYADTSLAGTDFEDTVSSSFLGYANFLTAGIDKITYMTPYLSGFQAGVSYTPDVANFNPASRSLNGNNPKDVLDEFGSAWEGAIRYETNSDESALNYKVGGGYTSVSVEDTNSASTIDTFNEWNIGAAVSTGSIVDEGVFTLGAAYTENNGGVISGNDSKTYVVGLDFKPDNTKYGISWLNNRHEESAAKEIKANRFTVGFVHDYAAGLSFSGSVSHVTTDVPSTLGGDVDGTAITIGTQILF